MKLTKQDREILSPAQLAKIWEWSNRINTDPPEMPIIPKIKSYGYFSKKRNEATRKADAGNAIAEQAWLKVFNNNELTGVYKLDNPKCGSLIFHRINQHFAALRKEWIKYGVKMWERKNK